MARVKRKIDALPSILRRKRPRREAPRDRIGDIYRMNFDSPRRERLFLSSVSFFLTFGGVRALTHAIKSGKSPLGNLSEGGTHIHHLVWGILGLLGVGYAWNAQAGSGMAGTSSVASRICSLSYGSASALTLDEFALWLNLEDDYWDREGRESIDAVVLFGSLLSIGAFGGGFLARVAHRGLRNAKEILR